MNSVGAKASSSASSKESAPTSSAAGCCSSSSSFSTIAPTSPAALWDGTGPLAQAKAFSGFSTDEAATVRSFYEDTLGLRVSEADGMLTLHLGGGTDVLVYPKGPEHVPATFPVLNFQVSDVEATVDDLTARGVQFERYEGTPV